MTFIYLTEHSFLTEHWLAEHPEEKAVTLIHEPAERELAETVKRQYSAVQRLLAADGELNAEVLQAGAPADTRPLSILLPVTLDIRPLRYRPYLYMPEVLPWYPLLQRCWRWGFRKATIFNLNGSWPMDMPHLLEEFHNRYKGRRCFIAGNGPSLNAIDMTRLKDEIVFGSNQCYLGYERWGFVFPYWGISDTYQIEEYALKYGALTPPESVHFFPCEYLPLLRLSNACPVNIGLGPEAAHQFSDHPDRLYIGHTVTHMLIQIAAVMGCDPIILIGVDHRYDVKPPSFVRKHLRRAHRYLIRRTQHTVPYKMTQAACREWVKGRPHATVESSKGFWDTKDTRIATHFDTRYTGQDARKFRLPEPEEAELDFECARRWAESHGRRILNATPGTALHVFEKVAYDSVF